MVQVELIRKPSELPIRNDHDSDESGMMEKSKEKLSGLSDKVGDAMDRSKQGASDLGGRISDQASTRYGFREIRFLVRPGLHG